MTTDFSWKHALLASSLLALAACGGSGGESAAPTNSNTAPTARAGVDQSVDEQSAVTLNGTGSNDADGDSLTYTWTQTGGTPVGISNGSSSQASFDAPDVGIGNNVTLTFQLRVSDGNASNTDAIDITVNGVSNSDPVVDAGGNQTVGEFAAVSLSGSASDTDLGDTLTYTWSQLSGAAVTIADSDLLAASFAAPAAGPAGETLILQLAVNDGTTSVTDTVTITVTDGLMAVTVSGQVFYEFVPPNTGCQGLNFSPAALQTRPIRAATVQLIDAGTNAVLDSVVASESGDYAFNNVAANLDVRLRVRAELKRAGVPRWDVEVRDNVDMSPNPPPLASRPLYVVDGANFNTGSAHVDRDLTATTGWGGNSYTGPRAAAPFAILDAVYSGIQLVLTADQFAIFGPMDAFWSVNNTLTSPTDIDAGELPSSFYRGDLDSLFLLGDANTDTEEFDDHVSMHEWGHYFEDVFSRSDSVGGPHSIGESIDARLAFGEGWATGLAAMALDDPLYCDTSVPGTNGGFGLNTETSNSGPQGWYNEMSVATFLYDLWDTGVDGTDTDSIGFGPIFDTMTGPQATTSAFTTLHSFAADLRPMLSLGQRNFVDSQLTRENIETSGIDIWASTQNNINIAPNNQRDVLPLYTTMPTDGTAINICTNADHDQSTDANGDRVRDGNKLAQYRYLRFTTAANSRYAVTVATTTATPVTADPDDRDQSDPDIYIYRRGQIVAFGQSTVDNLETFSTTTLLADTYVADVQEWRFADVEGAPDSYPEQICFDVTMAPF